MALEDGRVEVGGKKYQIVTLDFETFYDKDYTLSGKINTSEYVRDDRFHAHGVGIKVGNGPTLWYTGKNIPLALREIDWARSALLAHNTAFDGFICSHVYDIRPALYLDTLSMARAAHGHHMRHDLDTIAKAHGLAGKVKRDALADTKGKMQLTDKEERALGAYCVDDVNDTYKIFWKLFDHIPDEELQLIDMTQKMFSDPVLRVDIPRVQEELEKEVGGKAAALLRSGASVEDLMSNEKFADLLRRVGANPPMKISPSTGKPTYAFAKSDLAFQKLLQHSNKQVVALAEARLKVKSTIGETRAVRFLEAGKDGMCLPILLNYSGAHTHRWSGGNKMNLQNLKRGGELRRSILAPKGHVIVVADSAQIEARVLAWLAGQLDIVNAFAMKEDVYKLMASAIYGVPVDQVTKDQRFIGKTCIAEGTLVLSDSGWKPIEQVTIDDRLWDGEEWVCHQGLLNNGMRKTLSVCGAWMTPDHRILSATRWLDAQSVVRDENTLSQALDIGAANLPYEATYAVRAEGLPPSLSNAIARILSMRSTAIASGLSEAHAAQYAAEKPLQQNDTGPIAKRCRVMNTALDYLTASPPPLRDATQKRLSISSTTVGAELLSAVNGAAIKLPSSSTFRQFLGGMTQHWKWTALTTTRGITPATYASSPSPQTSETNVESLISKRVFDILNSGSRNRFTILTDAGPLIVHNCVLGLGYGMGHMKLQQTLKQGVMGPPVDISIEECKRIVNVYRSRNYKIRQLWKIMDGIIASMLTGTLGEFGPLTYGKGYIQLPSGLFLQYYGLHGEAEVRHDDLVVNEATYLTRQGRSKIYGGLLTENVVQALARCIISDQMLEISKKYRVVTMTHDEIVVVCPKKDAKKCLADMLQVMSTAPEWADGLPLAAEGDFDDSYSK